MPKRTAIDSYQLPLDRSYTNCGNAHSCPCFLPFNKPVPYHFLCGKLYFINLLMSLLMVSSSCSKLLRMKVFGLMPRVLQDAASLQIISHDHMMAFSAGLFPSSQFPYSLFPRAK